MGVRYGVVSGVDKAMARCSLAIKSEGPASPFSSGTPRMTMILQINPMQVIAPAATMYPLAAWR